MRFKVWLKGIPHHCLEKYIQGYSDEYHFRFNRRGFLDSQTNFDRNGDGTSTIYYLTRTKYLIL